MTRLEFFSINDPAMMVSAIFFVDGDQMVPVVLDVDNYYQQR